MDSNAHTPSFSQLVSEARALQAGVTLARARGMAAAAALLQEDGHLVLARLLRAFPARVTLSGGAVMAEGVGEIGTISDAAAAALGCREGASPWMN